MIQYLYTSICCKMTTTIIETSLTVQWLRLHLMQGVQVWFLLWELRSHILTWTIVVKKLTHETEAKL